MKNKFVIFFASFLLVGLFVLYLGRTAPKESPQPSIPQDAPPPKKAETLSRKIPRNALINVDFANASLDSVAAFVANVTKKGIVFNGQETVLISWMQQDVREAFLFNAFQNVLGTYNLTMRPINPQASAFEIVRLKDIPVPVRLDYAWSSRGLFFWFNSTIYPYEKFPYPLRRANGSWFALVPSQQAQQGAAQPRSPATRKNTPEPGQSS